MVRALSFWFLGFLSLSSAAHAQCDHDDADGADVAVVFSGGGALSSIQIGALKVVEEAGVPIHCVLGTSMGATVAGLYASGYSSHELEDIFTTAPWPELFAGAIPYRDQPYLQKEREAEYLSEYVAGISDEGVVLPGGFRSMQSLLSFYRSLTTHIPTNIDFDTLPTPYRSVTMDLSTGEAVALSEGDLVQAILASMAVPGVFPPRKYQGRTYVDGGMASQLPIRAARDMGADIVIAIDTTVEPGEVGDNISLAGTTQQIVQIAVWNNWQQDVKLLGDDDVLIRPDLQELTASTFQFVERGIEIGYQDAVKARPELERIRQLAAPSKRRSRPTEIEQDREQNLVINNTSPLSDELIRDRFSYEGLDAADLDTNSRRISDLSSFGGLGEVDIASDGENAVLTAKPRPLGRNLVQVGFNTANDFQGESSYELLLRLSRRPIRPWGGELSLDLELGTDVGIIGRWYQPFGTAGRYFFEPQLAFQGDDRSLDLDQDRIGEFFVESAEVRLRVGRELGDWGVIGLIGNLNTYRLETKVSVFGDLNPFTGRVVGELDTVTGNEAAAGIAFAYDTLDRLDFPRRGGRGTFLYEEIFDLDTDRTSTEIDALVSQAFAFGQNQVLLTGRYGDIGAESGTAIDNFELGGFRQLTSRPQDTIPAYGYSFGSIEASRLLNPSAAVVNVPLYAGFIAEYAASEFDFIGIDFDDEYYSIGGYLSTLTPIGPIFLGAAFGDEETRAVFLQVGRPF